MRLEPKSTWLPGVEVRRSPPPRRQQATRAVRGFTLLEIGVSLACIAVLLIVVAGSKGFLDNSKLRNPVDSVRTLQRAAFAWVERQPPSHHGYLGLDIGQLCVEGLLPTRDPADVAACGYKTAWGDAFVFTPQWNFLSIGFCTPSVELATDAKKMMNNMGSVTMPGGACACAGCYVEVMNN
jgi:type II secretory pathway pseudopilin PulG